MVKIPAYIPDGLWQKKLRQKNSITKIMRGKKMQNRIILIIAAVVLAFSLSGCDSKQNRGKIWSIKKPIL